MHALAGLLASYARWLHTRWPAGHVERLPEIQEDGRTNLPGVYVVGDLTGVPLLKFAAHTAARAVQAILSDPAFAAARARRPAGVHDLLIVGAGVSGMAAALEASRHGLDVAVFESKRRFQTVADFPRGKPIYTYPREFEPMGSMRFRADVKEDLLRELHEQTDHLEVHEGRVETLRRREGMIEAQLASGLRVRALRALVAIGRSGNFRRLGVPGEHLDKVYNRVHDPKDFRGRRVLVVGGGDSAVEAAIALVQCGADVTLSYRGAEFSRPKPENVERLQRLRADPAADIAVEEPVSERVTTAAGPYLGRDRVPGRLALALGTEVRRISDHEVVLAGPDGGERVLPNDVVFSMIGREAPLELFRRSAIRIFGDWTLARAAGLALFLVFAVWLYHWKAPYAVPWGWKLPPWLNPDPQTLMTRLESAGGRLSAWIADPATLPGTLRISAAARAFYYTLTYSILVVTFGVRRIRHRRTPYVRVQTAVLMAIQVGPLFVLPEILLPWLGHNGAFDGGFPKVVADGLFPESAGGHGREYWRAYGFVLAWPLMVWNWFTDEPLGWWLGLGFLQTFVLIPAIVYRWGKGAYCSWICSCGALAETLGDRHRHKMPHGPTWNRLNLVGQGVLAVAVVLLALRVAGWIAGPTSWGSRAFHALHTGLPLVNYAWLVDLMLAGVVGYGLYFWFSGRVWCRFACPLAALMHIYARFSPFRILADKKKCISCNVCTAVCHQGIDVMNFANKGLPMADPECVRCSACVSSCPTGVLTFGRVDHAGNVAAMDRLPASLLHIRQAE